MGHLMVWERVSTPERLKPKEFENLILLAGNRLPDITLSRYGVQASYFKNKLIAIPSLPDFEGILKGGRQFILEAKVVSGGSLALNNSIIKKRQVAHMLKRAEMGALCFFLVHYCARKLKTKKEAAATIAIPATYPGFGDYLSRGVAGGINLETALRVGRLVHWVKSKRMSKVVPDLRSLLHEASD